jgi:hypothetical protein
VNLKIITLIERSPTKSSACRKGHRKLWGYGCVCHLKCVDAVTTTAAKLIKLCMRFIVCQLHLRFLILGINLIINAWDLNEENLKSLSKTT